MKTNYLSTTLVGLLLCLPTIAQTLVKDYMELNQTLATGSYSYAGIHSVTLKPGFSYKATSPHTFRAFIAKQMTYQYDASGNRISRTIVLSTVRSATVTPEGKMEEQVSYEMNPPIAEETITKETSLKIYPNPVKNELNIQLSRFEEKSKGSISLFDAAGKMLANKQIQKQTTQLDMSRYNKGYYVLRITLDAKETTWKIIKE